jgi:hypothetical protein
LARRRKRNPDEGWRSYGPGKFDSMVDSFLYDAVMDGWGDEETGDSETVGHFDLMVGKILEAAEHGATLQSDVLTAGERDELKTTKAIIMEEGSQGFVGVEYFDKAADARAKWKEIEDDVAEFEGGGEED